MLVLLRSLAKPPLTAPARVRFGGSEIFFVLCGLWGGAGLSGVGVHCVGLCWGWLPALERGGKEKLLSRALTFLKSFRPGGITLSRDLPIQLMALGEEIYNNNANYSILITWQLILGKKSQQIYQLHG